MPPVELHGLVSTLSVRTVPLSLVLCHSCYDYLSSFNLSFVLVASEYKMERLYRRTPR
jgi:hypothetical protein